MNNNCDSDPGPARNTLDSLFAAVKQTKDDIVNAVLEMNERHKERKEMISRVPYKPLSQTDPYLPIDIHRRIAAAATRARNEVLQEFARTQDALMAEVQRLRRQILEETSPRTRAQLQVHLAEKARAGEPFIEIDDEDTEQRPALRSQRYEKEHDEMLYAFFIACFNDFQLKHERRAYSARLSAFNLSFLEQLIPESLSIRLIRDDTLPDTIMIMM